MSIGWDPNGKLVMGASSRQALHLLRYRYDLNPDGQIFGVSYRVDPATGRRQFSMRSHMEDGDRELSSEEIQAHVIDRHLNRWMEAPPNIDAKDRVADEMVGIPETSEVYDNPSGFLNSQTLQTIVSVLEEIAAGKRGKFECWAWHLRSRKDNDSGTACPHPDARN